MQLARLAPANMFVRHIMRKSLEVASNLLGPIPMPMSNIGSRSQEAAGFRARSGFVHHATLRIVDVAPRLYSK